VDEVGHRVFDSPDLVTPVSTSPVIRVDAVPEMPGMVPPLEPPAAEPATDLERRRRGMLYVRVLAAVGIVLTLLFLWQVLT